MLKVETTGIKEMQARIQRAVDSVDDAVIDGLLSAGEDATQVMEERTFMAETRTGIERVGEAAESGAVAHAGRIYTGRMIRSLRQDDGQPGALGYSAHGNIDYNVGYVNNPPSYTEKQESTPYSISGILNTIVEGWSEMATVAPGEVLIYIDKMVRDTETGDYKNASHDFQPVVL